MLKLFYTHEAGGGWGWDGVGGLSQEGPIVSCSVTASVITFVFLFVSVTSTGPFQVAKTGWPHADSSLPPHDLS